ncbi:amidohydrolase family protein [Gordonia sp. zg691]|uniref:Amidohydrolase family protein n=1 Tax=Gordonia jinghuaiqii TaxID=2758710 RepID=A0A7D7LT92_9ACTN|nr:amidohydrolase family protein [Gordonia jinghuaiqii]MBD0860675.1 amidohydrolase family protein [Gordonia jinghuaiqii]MCR5978059.1 amidohydrolase family protein [Gordonia jinghuaiqii]QMT01477.1 amidohydrolase family protein [Gordonia jinghuaiqii]
MRTVFSGGAVIIDAHAEVPSGFVVVDDGVITDVGDGEATHDILSSADRTVDTTGRLVMPGFINAHCHLFQSMLRGLNKTTQCLEDWLANDIAPYTARLQPADLYLAATAGLLENLRSGVTTVLENQYVHHHPDNTDRVARAFRDIGIRGLIARGGVDVKVPGVPNPRLETVDGFLDNVARFVSDWDGAANGRIRCEAAIQTTWLASGELCDRVGGFIADNRIGLHAHCAETRTSVASTIAGHGRREVPYFRDHGLIGPGTQLVHCVWIDPEECELIAELGATVVTCPTSNAYLASGPAPVSDLRALGVPVAIGCDGPGSNNGQNMFEAIKWSVLSDRLRTLDAGRLSEVDALDMAWRGGARAVGMEGRLGAVRAGHLADLVTLDVESPGYSGSSTLRRAVVFTGSPADVRDVWVDGIQVVRDSEVLTADRHDIHHEMRARRAAIVNFDDLAVTP